MPLASDAVLLVLPTKKILPPITASDSVARICSETVLTTNVVGETSFLVMRRFEESVESIELRFQSRDPCCAFWNCNRFVLSLHRCSFGLIAFVQPSEARRQKHCAVCMQLLLANLQFGAEIMDGWTDPTSGRLKDGGHFEPPGPKNQRARAGTEKNTTT